MIDLNTDACFRAVASRDARFDGRLFVGVSTTGVYCRPVCPARTPKRANCRFFGTAAAAQEAGFRPCLRCRPECAPDVASWRGTSNTVARALALIAEGALDEDDSGVDALAERLGVGGRQLRRLFARHLGASPLAVLQTRRLLFAKQLLQETRMPMADVAFASGFGSVRRFNETFQRLYGRPPSALRRLTGIDRSLADAGVTLRLPYRPPYDWDAMLEFLATRAVDGVEVVERGVYRRTVLEGGEVGTVEVAHDAARSSLAVTIHVPSVRALPGVVARVRRVFDLGADVEAIGEHLSRDPMLAPLVAERPGLRAPGAWDGFELAIRAILGQQVTVEAARRLASTLVEACGSAVEGDDPRLSLAFPTPERVAAADLSCLRMPGARRDAVAAIAREAIADPDIFRSRGTVEDAVRRLRAVPGIGEWTAHVIALRAMREPDAFPAGDVALLRVAADDDGARPTPAGLLRRSEAWRPWRAYAAQHLWAADDRRGTETRHD